MMTRNSSAVTGQGELRRNGRFVTRLLLILMLTALAGCVSKRHEFAGTVLEPPQPVPDFTLTSAAGPVRLSDYAGRYVYLYFGYTFCPDICPATLVDLARMRQALGDAADQVQVLMISVDPERDTPAHLADYVTHFDKTFVGVTGAKAVIDTVGEPYGLYYERHEGTAASGYLIDHSARVFLVDPQRQARVAYPFDTGAEALAADLRWLLAHE